jgi:apolipoprotein N-acyltransferase
MTLVAKKGTDVHIRPLFFNPTSKRLMPPATCLLSLVSGVLLVLSLPKPDLYPLAWVAIAPFLFAIATRPGSAAHTVITSYITGFVFFAGTCYWITETMNTYGGLSFPTALGVCALFALSFALYFVLFGLGLHLALKKFGTAGLLFAAPLWVTMEWLRSILFSGFPWMLSGYALVPHSGILQMAAWTGVYGLSFLATFVNSLIAFAVLERNRTSAISAALIVLVAWFLPVLGRTPSGGTIPVRLVQTNISLDQPWKKPDADQLLDELGALSTRDTSKPRLVVWPETPAPFYLNDGEFRTRMQNITRKLDAFFLVGYIDSKGEDPTNSAALLNPEGRQLSRYDKMHLVPFGEYVPFKHLLFFAQSLVREVGEFIPGTDYTVSQMDGHQISTAICYESIFPDLVRQFVKKGAELLVVITNDGWFGQSSAPYQHLRMGVVRSVENHRWMVRTANTGVSAIIDPYGKIEAGTPIGVRMILDGNVQFRTDRTFYTEYGDVFAYVNVLVAAAVIFWAKRKRGSAKP